MSQTAAMPKPTPDADVCTPGWYVERARALLAEHAELFRGPVIKHSRRSLSVAPARRAHPKSPQLRLPLRPTMRR